MFTTCPKCALNLALTVADLRLGQGFVRCGRCANVFNALTTLTDEGEADDSAAATMTRPALDLDAIQVEEQGPDSIEVIEHDLAEPEAAGTEVAEDHATGAEAEAETEAEAEAGQAAADPGATTGENEVLRTGTFETIVLEGDGITQTEETVAESEVDAQLQALVQRFGAVHEHDAADAGRLDLAADEPVLELDEDDGEETPLVAPEVSALIAAAAPAGVATPPDAALPAQAPLVDPALAAAAESAALPRTEDPLLDAGTETPAAQPHRRAWLAASVALALLLAAQLVHQFRESLVSLPWAADPLSAVYGLFHVTLEPRWDLAAYEVRQLGADAVPGATPQITVRASVHNRAAHAQPPPLLRVTLQDRFGHELTTREVAPASYLRGVAPARLGADQRVDATLTLPDPGQNAVGFEIDACLRDARNLLRCAEDPPSR